MEDSSNIRQQHKAPNQDYDWLTSHQGYFDETMAAFTRFRAEAGERAAIGLTVAWATLAAADRVERDQ